MTSQCFRQSYNNHIRSLFAAITKCTKSAADCPNGHCLVNCSCRPCDQIAHILRIVIAVVCAICIVALVASCVFIRWRRARKMTSFTREVPVLTVNTSSPVGNNRHVIVSSSSPTPKKWKIFSNHNISNVNSNTFADTPRLSIPTDRDEEQRYDAAENHLIKMSPIQTQTDMVSSPMSHTDSFVPSKIRTSIMSKR